MSETEATETILLVDDTPINLTLLRAIVGGAGYRTIEARDGVEAMEKALEETPDLILLDIMMPRKDGFETCAELKEHLETADIPVIFLSALSEAADKVRGLELGAADYVTKPFDKGEIVARVRTQLDLRRLNRDLAEANRELRDKQERLEESMRAGSAIQKALLPRSHLRVPGLDIAWRFLPCDAIGGDIFNVLRLGEQVVGFYMVDVSGHGVPSALVTVSVVQSLSPSGALVVRNEPENGGPLVTAPAEVLEQLDAEYPIERFDKHFTMNYLTLELDGGRLRYCSAAHPPPILIRTDGTTEHLDEGGSVIGLGGLIPFEEGVTTLDPGDRLVLYTDGVLELANRKQELLGAKRFNAMIESQRERTLEQLCDGVMESLEEFREGASPRDDISLLAVERTRDSGDAS